MISLVCEGVEGVVGVVLGGAEVPGEGHVCVMWHLVPSVPATWHPGHVTRDAAVMLLFRVHMFIRLTIMWCAISTLSITV